MTRSVGNPDREPGHPILATSFRGNPVLTPGAALVLAEVLKRHLQVIHPGDTADTKPE